jgi:hypothetical protein
MLRSKWLLVLALVFSADAFAEPPLAKIEEKKGPTRIDFDDRVIQGQTNTSGAVYLLDRKDTAIHSMVRLRTTFLHLTLRKVYDR